MLPLESSVGPAGGTPPSSPQVKSYKSVKVHWPPEGVSLKTSPQPCAPSNLDVPYRLPAVSKARLPSGPPPLLLGFTRLAMTEKFQPPPDGDSLKTVPPPSAPPACVVP